MSASAPGEVLRRAHQALERGDLALARSCAQRALTLDPGSARAHFILFQAFWHEGRFDAAERSFKLAAALDAGWVDARRRLGEQAFAREQFEWAARHYHAYIQARPGDANGWTDLGLSLMRVGNAEAAQDCFERAIGLAPSQPRHLAMLAVLLREQERTHELLPVLERLIGFAPDAVEVRLDLAICLVAQNRYREAKQHLARLLEREPLHLAARWLMFQRPDDVVAPDQAARERYLAQWRDGIAGFERLDGSDARVAAQASATLASSTAFYLAYLGRPLVEEHRRNAAVLRRLALAAYPGVSETTPRAIGAKRRRVLLFSPSLQNHSVERVWGAAWTLLDPAEFELCVMYPRTPDESLAAHWRERGIRFEAGVRAAAEWIALIQAFAPDIAVWLDIGMQHTTQALPALRLAPVQATTWAHPVTSGMSTVDYFLSADACEPADGQAHYVEKLVRLPRLGAYVRRPEWEPPHAPATADAPLRFFCSQLAAKLHPGHDPMFARVLAAVPGAQLDILCAAPEHMAHALAARMRPVFAAHGVDFDARCRVQPLLPAQDYRALLARADVCLDSLDFSGCLTSLDALWCDRPIVTLPGALMRGRQTAGLLGLIGLHELIAATPDDYVRIATRLAHEPDRRAEIRARIGARKLELFEDRAALDALAQFLRTVEPVAV